MRTLFGINVVNCDTDTVHDFHTDGLTICEGVYVDD
jgi:hypothetical protein